MIDIKDIEKEIEKLENSDCVTYNICDKLAMLYIVRDHYYNKEEEAKMTPPSIAAMPPMTMGTK